MRNIYLYKGSLLDLKVDALVNAANTTLLGGGGVDGAIHLAAGKELLEECRKLNGCKEGEAKITKAYNIKDVKNIIHTVGPIYSNNKEDALVLSNCYYNSLDLAKEYNLKSIAFPCISTGVYGYPIKEAAMIALETINKWLANNKYDIDIYLCCFRDEEYEVYKELINN